MNYKVFRIFKLEASMNTFKCDVTLVIFHLKRTDVTIPTSSTWTIRDFVDQDCDEPIEVNCN